MSIADYIAECCSASPWFNANHETVVLGRTAKHDDDPLLSDQLFLLNAKPTKRYPELAKIQLPCDWMTADADLPYPDQYVARIGQSGWNHVNQVVRYVCIEFDAADEHATTGITPEQLSAVEAALSEVTYAEVRRSTGGGGLHVRICLANPVPASTRAEYQATTRKVFANLCERFPMLRDLVDRSALGRGVLWLWADKMNADSFRLVSPATEDLDLADWQPTPELPAAKRAAAGFDVKAVLKRNEIAYTEKKYDKADNGTGYLLTCPEGHGNDAETKTMVWSCEGVPCFHCFADKCKNRDWAKFIKDIAPNDPSAKLNPSDFAVLTMLYQAAGDELFCDHSGNPHVTCRYGGRPPETVRLASKYYRLVIRRRYCEATGRTAAEEHVSLAVAELTAKAVLDSPRYPVFVRVGHSGDVHFLDLCDEKRRAIKIDKTGWTIVDAPADVRFTRPTDLLPRRSRHMAARLTCCVTTSQSVMKTGR